MSHKPKTFKVGPCGKNIMSQNQAIGQALRSSRMQGQGLRVYYCNRCKGHHLTKQPKRK